MISERIKSLRNVLADSTRSATTRFALVNSGGSFYLFGGTDGSARQSDVYHFETDSLAWNKVAAIFRRTRVV